MDAARRRDGRRDCLAHTEKDTEGTLANYGYENKVLLPVPLTVATGYQAAQLDIRLKASWLICKKECIPQEGDFSLQIPVKSSTALSSGVFAAAFAASPQALGVSSSQIEVAPKPSKCHWRVCRPVCGEKPWNFSQKPAV